MRLYACGQKQVLRLKNNAEEFIRQFSTDTPEASHGAFVDVRGKIVAVFLQKRISKDEILIVIERQFLDRLQKHLEKYLNLNGVILEAIDLRVFFDMDGSCQLSPGEIGIPENKGRWIVTRGDLGSTVTEDEFTLFRVKNNIPLQGIDFDEEMLLNVADEKWVSYTKGCYLGQEIIARVHFRSKPPKKLAVRTVDETNVDFMTSKVMDIETGRAVGFVFEDTSF